MESILEEAQRLIHGQRNKDYGHPRENIGHTAAMWSAYLGVEVTPMDVCHMMQQLKQSRMKTTGQYHRDSNVDIAGYAGVEERIYEEQTSGQAPEHVAGFEELQAQIPREWESLADVPHDVRVKDLEGDVWIYYDGPRGVGWGWQGRPSPFPIDNYRGPFIEILGD